jgi:hypothetical protein
MTKWIALAIVVMVMAATVSFQVSAQQNQMSFFVTSAGSGNGANLGGLAGGDKICQTLAAGAGAGAKTWHAYLSTKGADGKPGVNAKDRIGNGPWYNAKGVMIAKSVADLHSDSNNIKKDTALTEKGTVVNGVGDTPNQHDILTGSQPDGRAYTDAADHTCSNYTSNVDVPAPARGAGGGAPAAPAAHGPSVQLGHSDKQGGGNGSWNSTHASRGCSQANLVSTGGAGLLYCFAAQ